MEKTIEILLLYKRNIKAYNVVMKTTYILYVFIREKEAVMHNYILTCCSTADLFKEHFEKRALKYVCYHYEIDGKEYLDDLGETMDIADFYKAMEDGAMTKTSQVSVGEYEEFWDGFLKEGKDVLHVCLSSGISGTYNSANIAKSLMEEKYPDRKIYVVDSLNASAGFGLIMDKLADLRDEGKNIDEVYEWIMENRLKCHAWFFTSNLTYLVRGGRVSKASGFVGSALSICPLMHINTEGKLMAYQKIRTKRKVISAIVNQMEALAQDGLDYSDKCFISHSACLEDAKAVAELIETRFPKLNGKVNISNVGTTIGSHTGPGTVALFFWGKERE